MDKFIHHEGLVVPLDRANVDTDAIIPKQFLSSIKRSGFGQNLFDEWRYLDHGMLGQDCSTRPLNQSFPLNLPQHAGASILLARENFGCGSSREHAVWALCEYGFKAIVAPSFADIFHRNSLNNGLLPITLAPSDVDRLFDRAGSATPLRLCVDLPTQIVHTADRSFSCPFDIDPLRKARLLEGLDDVALTERRADTIRAFQQRHWDAFPWLPGPV